jgi:hypothetical protein
MIDPAPILPQVILPNVLPAAFPWLDLAGLAVFAASGALAAARRGMTIVTFCFFALVTGVGRRNGARSPDRGAGVLGA